MSKLNKNRPGRIRDTEVSFWGVQNFPVTLRREFTAEAMRQGKTVAELLTPILLKWFRGDSITHQG